jgi:glycine/D-amino acid oxidase-like deaminating enzyme
MARDDTVAVVGAGVIGAAVAYALTREGRAVLLLDRAEPGMTGASFGNAGHIAAELVEPLPSWDLLFGFWRELFAFGGVLDIPLRRIPEFQSWAWRFAAAARHRAENTRHLAPLVRPAASHMARWLAEIGRPELLRTNGHYQVWFGPRSDKLAAEQSLIMERLGIPMQFAPNEILEAIASQSSGSLETKSCRRPKNARVAGLWFPSTAHVRDPLKIVQSLVAAAFQRGASFQRSEVHAIQPLDGRIVLHTSQEALSVGSVVVCTGAWTASLLEPLGLRVPMESARGYHIEMPGHPALTDAPILYADSRILLTPMEGRLRATSFMEFAGRDAAPDPRKLAQLSTRLANLGYDCSADGPSWVGPRPVLPDYLPGIGRLESNSIFYAVGHQHIGLTLAPVTAELISDLVAKRQPRHDISAFDLRRF